MQVPSWKNEPMQDSCVGKTERKGEIASVLDAVRSATAQILEAILPLASKLQPVLRNDPAVEPKNEGTPAPSCPLAQELSEVAHRLIAGARDLSDLHKRCEL